MIYYGRNEKEAAVQGWAVLSSGEPDRASGVLLRRGGEEPLCWDRRVSGTSDRLVGDIVRGGIGLLIDIHLTRRQGWLCA